MPLWHGVSAAGRHEYPTLNIFPPMQAQFEQHFKVRDYECDLQGIVNNAIYQHYTEHTRNEFLRTKLGGIDHFHQRGIDTVVARLEMQFKAPLRPGDEFVCTLNVRKEGLKYLFSQDILRLPERKLCVHALTTVVCVVNGRLGRCDELDVLLPGVESENIGR